MNVARYHTQLPFQWRPVIRTLHQCDEIYNLPKHEHHHFEALSQPVDRGEKGFPLFPVALEAAHRYLVRYDDIRTLL